ncbi:hypothetical protein EV385_6472 [Krasilnikovia cinnamomea]|uniref:Phosphopantetheine binding protein n=1 Tax=Krasilnikovia cinnamomea TaxID=349313 RepID=A0A4Q7ZUD7_9ACTN|nr:hypothetical protein [Krasilnikovia cinnamomea]RZU54521.1 hypothetical protein EV385_6472 [Krasilnikovia cinnamomea]
MSAEVRTALREWVAVRNPDLDPATLTDQTPLISTRLVTSLHVVELLLLIEELRAAPVDPRSLAPGAFTDIDTIVRAFFGQDAAAGVRP